jgi:branched-chain amino acid transport system ATP-binding protein
MTPALEPAGAGGALLAASSVRMEFDALVVLDGVSFAVAPEEAVGVVGPNGAGKTTLLNVLAGAYRPTAGTVRFQGGEVTGLDAAERCRLGVARTHQIPRPFGGMTVFENVLAAARHGGGFAGQEAYRRGIEALELCGMPRLANRRAGSLGLLDRKRLELARAIATDPVLVLLDEIGGGLTDGETEELVGTVQSILARHIAIVWIEHIVHVLLRVTRRLICMDAGRIIADGEPRAVMADAGVIDAYLGGSR